MTKAELHRFVDELPEESVDAVAVLLQRAQDPVIAKLDAAPYDDEPFSDAERCAAHEAAREPGIPLDRVNAELDARLLLT